jgi:hypothetical protein
MYEIVDDGYGVTALDQALNGHTADVSGPPGNGDSHASSNRNR